jgi:hypothetical protein
MYATQLASYYKQHCMHLHASLMLWVFVLALSLNAALLNIMLIVFTFAGVSSAHNCQHKQIVDNLRYS